MAASRGAIFFKRPESTFLGPTSTNTFTPASEHFHHDIKPPYRTCQLMGHNIFDTFRIGFHLGRGVEKHLRMR